MTTDEMQRLLDGEAERGHTEFEAYKYLVTILGLKFHKINKPAPENDEDQSQQ